MIVLGIETSCDETAVALVNEQYQPIAQKLTRQIEHEEWGGVVPETASRAHLELLDDAVRAVLRDANFEINDIDAIAVTNGPGLAGALWVGVSYASGLGLATGIPVYGVHHLEAHLWAVKLFDSTIQPPFLALLVSGGHSMIVKVNAYRSYELLGTTLDDAAGEAFDKAARLMQIGFPGGPAIERAAEKCQSSSIELPVAKTSSQFDFSFSGLKSALARAIQIDSNFAESIPEYAFAFQTAAITTLTNSVERVWKLHPKLPLVVSGGVAANRLLRQRLQDISTELQSRFIATPLEYCTDNGVMIAVAGHEMIRHDVCPDSTLKIYPRFPLQNLSVTQS